MSIEVTVEYAHREWNAYDHVVHIRNYQQLQAKVAELEAEVERLSAAHVKACQANADSQAELAASQLHAEQLRVALTTCVCAMQDYQAGIGITEMFDKGERLGRKALARPSDISALDAYVAEKIKEYN